MKNSKPLLSKNKFFILLFYSLYFVSFLFLFSRKGFELYFHPFPYDSFMDFFNMAAKPFSSIYPPLSLIPFKILHLTPYPDVATDVCGLKSNIFGAFSLMLYIFAFCSVFLFTIYHSVNGGAKRKVFYSVLFLFSGITLWTIERGNIMSFAFLFSLLFVVLYSNGDEKKKRISYVLLALAISLKLYPGAFLLLLLEKKDGKGILSVALQTFFIFVFSYCVCKQLDNVIAFERNMGVFEYIKDTKNYLKVMMRLAVAFLIAAAACFVLFEIYKQNWKLIKILCGVSFVILALAVSVSYFADGVKLLAKWSAFFAPVKNALKFGTAMTASLEGVNVSFKNCSFLIHYLLTGGISISKQWFFPLSKFFCCGLCIFSFVVNKQFWKKLASIALLCIYVPDFSGTYLLVYLLIPLLFFINNSENGKTEYIYACLFAISTTFLVIPYTFDIKSYYLLTGSFVAISLSVFALFLLLVANAVYELIKTKFFRGRYETTSR